MDTTLFIFKKPKDDIFWTSSALFFLAASLFIVVKIIKSDNVKVLAFVLPIVFLSLALIILKVLIIRRQYYKIDKDKRILVDKTNGQIKIESQQKTFTISHSDIDNVEVYSSWNTIPLFSTLGYTRFNLSDGQTFIVTKFTADEYDLQTFITRHRHKTVRHLMNKV
jgi:hypothetical protein